MGGRRDGAEAERKEARARAPGRGRLNESERRTKRRKVDERERVVARFGLACRKQKRTRRRIGKGLDARSSISH